jgi:hypothetical protein
MRDEGYSSMKALGAGCGANLLSAIAGAVLGYTLTPESGLYAMHEVVMARFLWCLGGFIVGSIIGAFIAWRVGRWIDKPNSTR